MKIGLRDSQIAIVLYAFSLVFLLLMPYLINHPVGDEASYLIQTKLLLEGKTQPNWLLSTSYLTMLTGMPFIEFGMSLFSLRLLMVIIGALSTPLMYLILREFNIEKYLAIFGALILITNPFVSSHLRQFITEPISLPLYLLSLWFIVKGIKTEKNNLMFVGGLFGILGFFNRQFDAIPALAAILFLLVNSNAWTSKLIGLNKKLPRTQSLKTILHLIPVAVVVVAYFSYLYLTAGGFTNPVTVPYTNEHALLKPQFGINLQSVFRLMQDLIFVGFMIFPFSLFIRRHVKGELGPFKISQQLVVISSVLIGILAVLSGKEYIVYSNQILVFIVVSLFAYSSLNLGLLIIENRKSSVIMNYIFLAAISCVTFTVLKIGVFILKYYIIFLPLILIFLTSKIKSKLPYIITILIMGVYSVALNLNDVQFQTKVWNEVDSLVNSGVDPTNIQSTYTVVNWLSNSVDNPKAEYNIIFDRHPVLSGFIDIESIRTVHQR